MRRILLAVAVLTLVVLLAGSSQAQITFAAGPRIGFNLGHVLLTRPSEPVSRREAVSV